MSRTEDSWPPSPTDHAIGGAGVEQAPRAVFVSDAIQDLVLESADIGEFLRNLSREAAAELSTPESEVFCAVLLVRPRSRATMASNSPEASAMDEVQFEYDDGPCLRAARDQRPWMVGDFETDTRFGDYAEAILHTGVRSAAGVPIMLDGGAVAALDCYSGRPGEFDAARYEAATTFADEASRALRTAVHIAHLTDTVKNLKIAMESRSTIQLAAGIIMGQNRCSHDTAISILKSASNTRNVKLSAVAAAVLMSIGQEPPSAHFSF